MRLMIDTNIFIDVLAERAPFCEASEKVLRLCEEKKVEGFVSASSITDIFYLIRRQLHSTKAAYEAVGAVLDLVKVLPVTNEHVLQAYMTGAPDFEDCLLATCAKAHQCNAIVTRNKKDFQDFGIKILAPEDLYK